MALLAACGGRTGLKLDLDAATPFDVPTAEIPPSDRPLPVDVPTPTTLEVQCPAATFGRQGETIAFAARAITNRPTGLTQRWTVVRAPVGSMSTPTPPELERTTLALDAGGEYLLRFTATTADGLTRSCDARVIARPAIDLLCPQDQSNYQGATVPLVARATSAYGRPLRFAWSTIARPPASATAPVPPDDTTASLRLDALGDWRLRLVALDSAGMRAECETRVHADPDVIVRCPPDSRSAPFSTVSLAGEAASRLGLPLTHRWEIVENPITSTASIPSPSTRVTPFTFDVAGDWTWRFTATNSRGNSASCTTRARAVSSEAVRVEIVWNTDRSCAACNAQGGGIDIDLHLADVSRAMGRWAGRAPDQSDCYYANCVCGAPGTLCESERLDWAPPGRPNNPQLDIDHISDLPGPENINVVEAVTGAQYDVGVHFYSGHGKADSTPVVVRVYCAGAVVFESEAARIPERSAGGGDNNLWRVGRVTITPGGCAFERCGAPGMLDACVRAQSAW